MFPGKVLTVWSCTQLMADKIYWNYQVGNFCYKYLPVEINETLYFVLPGSKDLITSALKVNCDHHIIGIYHDQDGYFTEQGLIPVTKYSAGLAWQPHQIAITFKQPLLFHDRLAGAGSDMMLIRSQTN